ncbi:MAG: hypothetical protein ORN83_15165, partial [Chthoniobacteraceae bacterium]|nr:hypothetical protein [Chthoniobacteraceae bacterium]
GALKIHTKRPKRICFILQKFPLDRYNSVARQKRIQLRLGRLGIPARNLKKLETHRCEKEEAFMLGAILGAYRPASARPSLRLLAPLAPRLQRLQGWN